MGKLRFAHLFGVFVAVLSYTIVAVHGQSDYLPSTSTSTEQGLPSSTSEESNTSTTGFAAGTYGSSTTTDLGSSTTEDLLLSDCSTPIDLQTYCSNRLTAEEWKYFGNDTSISDLLFKLLSPDIVDALYEQCVPGMWCLDVYYRNEIANGQYAFYTSPISQSDNVWTCLESIQATRQCNDSDLFFLMSSVGVLYDMAEITGGTISDVCYTRALETMHIFYTDNTYRKLQDEDTGTLCSDYNRQMTNTYVCAVNSCGEEQRIFLEDFGPWERIASIAESVLENCELSSLQCLDGPSTQNESESEPSSPTSANPQYPDAESTSDLEAALDRTEAAEEERLNEEIAELEDVIEQEEMIEEIESEFYDETTPSYITVPSDENSGLGSIQEQGMDTHESQEDLDQSFVYGMVTVTVVVVISLTLIGVMAFKRFSRMRMNYKLGYSQMTEEESRMLRNEYN